MGDVDGAEVYDSVDDDITAYYNVFLSDESDDDISSSSSSSTFSDDDDDNSSSEKKSSEKSSVVEKFKDDCPDGNFLKPDVPTKSPSMNEILKVKMIYDFVKEPESFHERLQRFMFFLDDVMEDPFLYMLFKVCMRKYLSMNSSSPNDVLMFHTITRFDSDEIEDRECMLCFHHKLEWNDFMMMPCEHYFHDQCLIHVWDERMSCPICKKSILDVIENMKDLSETISCLLAVAKACPLLEHFDTDDPFYIALVLIVHRHQFYRLTEQQ